MYILGHLDHFSLYIHMENVNNVKYWGLILWQKFLNFWNLVSFVHLKITEDSTCFCFFFKCELYLLIFAMLDFKTGILKHIYSFKQ